MKHYNTFSFILLLMTISVISFANSGNNILTSDCSQVSNSIGSHIFLGEYNNSKYYCSNTNDYTWSQAKAAAEANGGHLAIVDDASENEFIKSGILADYVWLGLTDESSEGTFKTVFGDLAPYLNWNSGEPNNGGGTEHYVRLMKSNGKWTDRNASFTAEYVMEIPCPDNGGNPPTGCVASKIAHWDLDGCTAYSSDGSNLDYSEFTADTNTPAGFSLVNATILSHDGGHSCTLGSSGEAICSSILDNCSWSDNSSKAFTFSATISPSNGGTASITKLSFYEAAPLNYSWIDGASGDNDPPSKYGIRVLKNGTEIFQQTDIATSNSWSLEEFDFSNDADFTVSAQTTFEFELLGYCRSEGTSGVAAWDLDEIKLYGCGETVSCVDQGGVDTDGDGICDEDDCAPNNDLLPTTPGTACNDGNSSTNNDVIQLDGCTCSGDFITQGDCCEEGGDKVNSFTFRYNGLPCSASTTTQDDGKWNCDEFNGGLSNASSVYIVSSQDDDGGGDIYFEGTVDLSSSFTASATGDDFPSHVYLNIYSSNGGTLLQRIDIHASCSAPVVIGEQFGSLLLLNATFKNGFSCGPDVCDPLTDGGTIIGEETGCAPFDPTVIVGEEINDPTPPSSNVDCCESGGDKVKAFTLEFNGLACSASTTTQDDGKWNCDEFNGGFSNPSSVYIVSSQDDDGGGDIYFEGNVDLNSIFTATATGDDFPSHVYFNIYSSNGGTLLQRVDIHASCSAPVVIGEQFGSLLLIDAEFKNGFSCGSNPGGSSNVDCCESGGDKVKAFTLEFNGLACSASTTTQDDGKWNCDEFNGGFSNPSSVYIVSSQDDDGGGDIYFEGNVDLNSIFTATATGDDFPSHVYFNIYSSNGGTLLQRVDIHASCSAPVVIGEQFGSLLLINAEFKNGFSCGPAPSEFEYIWTASTTDCPVSTANPIPGANGVDYDPGFISETTYYVRWVRRTNCVGENGGAAEWTASNCIVKTVEEDICVCLGIDVNDIDGGTITFADGSDQAIICVDDVPDPLDVILSQEAGNNMAWVITDTNLEILGLPAGPPFDLNGAGEGTCLIWHLSYEIIEGAEVGKNAADLTGCFDLSNPLTVVREICPLPNIIIDDIVVNEEDGTATLNVCLDQISDLPVTVSFGTADGSAILDSDYSIATGQLTFAPGDLCEEIIVNIIDDENPEPTEELVVNLSTPTNAVIADPQGTITILDTDQAPIPNITIDDIIVNEEDGSASLNVCLDQVATSPVNLNYTTNDGSAISGSDYLPQNGILIIPTGESCVMVTIGILNDPIPEPTEELVIDLFNPTNAVIADPQGTITILDVDVLPDPVIEINDITVNEEDGSATLDICLSAISNNDVTVNYATADNTAFDNIDYTATSGQVTIPAGQLCASVTVPIIDDATPEPTEDLVVNLSNPTNATIGDPQGTITILDTDVSFPDLTINDIIVNEEDGIATLEICLDQVSAETVTVDYFTVDGTAFQGTDYVGFFGTATILAGELCTTVQVTIIDDENPEPTEELVVNLTNPSNAGIADPQGTITILDTDVTPVIPNVDINDVTVFEEDGTATLEICLDVATTLDVTVDFETADGTAIVNSDYTAKAGQVTILAGELCASVTILITDDNVSEPTEFLALNLTASTNSTIVDPLGTITILDGDIVPDVKISINDITVYEEDGTATLTVCLDQMANVDVTMDYNTVDDTALEGVDYVAESGSLTIPAGTLCVDVVIDIVDDATPEDTEVLEVVLSNENGAVIADGIGTITILDADVAPIPSLIIKDVTVNEEDGTATLDICMSEVSAVDVTVDYITEDGSAIDGSDYSATSGTATILAGELCTSVNVPIIDDEIEEDTEVLFVNLSSPTNATIADPQGTVTILDTDTPPGGCDDISITESNGVVTTSGYSDPIVFVKIYNDSWQLLFDSGMLLNNETQTYTLPGAGSYWVFVKTYDTNWAPLCDEYKVIKIDEDPNGICTERIATNVTPCSSIYGGTPYAGFLKIIGQGWFYDIIDGQLIENTDGTAILTGIWVNHEDPNLRFDLEINLSGKTGEAPLASPKVHECITPDYSRFYYYSDFTGTLTGQGLAEGAVIDLYQFGSAFQLGNGANSTGNTEAFGASAWLDGIVSQQPTTSLTIEFADVGLSQVGDLNIDLSGAVTDCPPCVDADNDGNCDDYKEVCTERAASNVTPCASIYQGNEYGGFLKIEGEGWFYNLLNAELIEYADGTALLTGKWQNHDNGNLIFDLVFNLSGKTGVAVGSSPKIHECLTPDYSAIYYYSELEGTLVGQGIAGGAIIEVADYRSAFQIGVGANSTGGTEVFGASAWLEGVVLQQPNSGLVINFAAGAIGDLNIDLSGSFDDCPPCDDVDNDGNCDERKEICTEREATNVTPCATIYQGNEYGGFLNIIGQGWFYNLLNAEMIEYTDGTALLTGKWQNYDNGNLIFDIVFNLSGKTSVAEGSSPKEHECINPDYDRFYYYSVLDGKLIGQGLADGALIEVSNFESAFQIGVGANSTGIDEILGASAWLDGTIITQPTSGLVIEFTPGGQIGDLNVNLTGTVEDCPADATPPITNSPCGTVVTPGNGSISISGYSEPIAIIQVFDANWSLVYSCMADGCTNPLTIDGLSTGTYYVKVNLYDDSWKVACTEYAEYITVATSLESQSNSYLYFKALKDKREVALNWTINTAYKTDMFITERSKDGINFEPILDMVNDRDTEDATNYQDTDKAPMLGRNYYRLKQTFNDGTFRYSKVQTVDFDLKLNDFTLYPNPTTDMIYVNLSEYSGLAGTIQLTNNLGVILQEVHIDAIPLDAIGLEVANYPAGMFSINVKLDNYRQLTKRFVKARK